MKTRSILIALCAVAQVAFAGCKSKTDPAVVNETAPQVIIDTVEIEPIADEPEPEPVVAPAPKPAAKAAQPKGKGETFYVSSFDEKGDVWGHVTMNGDRGTGVIQDSHENTYTVTCTRHGNELFAVDQNSRQYVFKIGQ